MTSSNTEETDGSTDEAFAAEPDSPGRGRADPPNPRQQTSFSLYDVGEAEATESQCFIRTVHARDEFFICAGRRRLRRREFAEEHPMIHAIRCDQPDFHEIEFESGFNVVLATRTKDASDRDSRNGAGKTTFIEIVHFCLGSSANKKNRLMVRQLHGWTFTVELDLRGKRYSVSRSTTNPRRVTLVGDFDDWPQQPKKDSKTGEFFLSVPQWSDVLGWLMFNLSLADDEPFEPTFRSLFSYFVRRGRDAFSTPFEHFRKNRRSGTSRLTTLSCWVCPGNIRHDFRS